MLNRKSVKIVDTGQLMKRYSRRQSELQRRQRTYRKDLEKPNCFKRNEFILMESYKEMAQKMKNEKDTLKAQIWTATGKSHTTKNSQELKSIQCLVDCYISLSEEVQQTKNSLANLNHTLSLLDKELYTLNMNDRRRSKQNFEKAVKRLQVLEDRYEDMIHLECKLSEQSEKLRRIISDLLHERYVYGSLYTKHIQRLNEGKKYLTDLLHYALNQIELVIDMYEKIELNSKHNSVELEKRKHEMRDIQRKHLLNEILVNFHMQKLAPRSLTPVSGKHIKRKKRFLNKYLMKINLYNDILKKIREYTKSYDVRSVITKFQQQESLYYSYFNYANEISYRITLLNNSVARLFKEIHFLKINNRDKQRNQIEYMENLNVILEEKRANNKKLLEMSQSQDERIGKLFEALTLIRDKSYTDASILEGLFEDNQEINLRNMREQMKLIEKRIYSIVCATYLLERQNQYQNDPGIYIVKRLDKVIEQKTEIDQIVPTTQCAECAEADTRDLDDDDAQNTSITSLRTMKMYVAEKVVQPDMQYRLHGIDKCCLPRSRYLAHRQSIS